VCDQVNEMTRSKTRKQLEHILQVLEHAVYRGMFEELGVKDPRQLLYITSSELEASYKVKVPIEEGKVGDEAQIQEAASTVRPLPVLERRFFQDAIEWYLSEADDDKERWFRMTRNVIWDYKIKKERAIRKIQYFEEATTSKKEHESASEFIATKESGYDQKEENKRDSLAPMAGSYDENKENEPEQMDSFDKKKSADSESVAEKDEEDLMSIGKNATFDMKELVNEVEKYDERHPVQGRNHAGGVCQVDQHQKKGGGDDSDSANAVPPTIHDPGGTSNDNSSEQSVGVMLSSMQRAALVTAHARRDDRLTMNDASVWQCMNGNRAATNASNDE